MRGDGLTALERLRAADNARLTPLQRASVRALLFIKVNRCSWQRSLKGVGGSDAATDRRLRRFKLRAGDVLEAWVAAALHCAGLSRRCDTRPSGVLRPEAGVGVIDAAHAP